MLKWGLSKDDTMGSSHSNKYVQQVVMLTINVAPWRAIKYVEADKNLKLE